MSQNVTAEMKPGEGSRVRSLLRGSERVEDTSYAGAHRAQNMPAFPDFSARSLLRPGRGQGGVRGPGRTKAECTRGTGRARGHMAAQSLTAIQRGSSLPL